MKTHALALAVILSAPMAFAQSDISDDNQEWPVSIFPITGDTDTEYVFTDPLAIEETRKATLQHFSNKNVSEDELNYASCKVNHKGASNRIWRRIELPKTGITLSYDLIFSSGTMNGGWPWSDVESVEIGVGQKKILGLKSFRRS